MKIVIIGGVAGGMSAATRLRRLNEDAEIIIIEKGPYVSFANCGLPYYVSGQISERDDLLVQTPEKLRERFQLDVRPESEVTSISPDKKEVTVASKNGEYQLSYDKLILSPGAKPFVPPIAGFADADNVFTLRNVPDVDAIMSFIAEKQPKKAAVIGAGFIGLEMAENLAEKGLDVTIIEKAPHVLPPVDEEIAAHVTNELQAHQVNVMVTVGATEFQENGRKIILDDGSIVETDMILLSVGVQPENKLAVDAGIATGMRGGILVDDNYETSVKDIYAVGDAIIVKHTVTAEDTMIALASPANRQGRQVADIISGLARKNRGSLGTAIVRVFDKAIASTGMNERQLKLAGRDYQVVHVQGKSHAGYYPGASDLTLKLLFHPKTGEIYGAQAVGEDGVDKRIDIIATAIKAGLTVADLPELEFTYAPPFGSAKDPVNMAGYAALNIIEGLSDTIQWYELDAAREAGAYLLDVRNENEFDNAPLADFVNIPLDNLRCRLHEVPKDKEVIVSCASGQRSYLAERILKQSGYNVKNLDGAYAVYAMMHNQGEK